MRYSKKDARNILIILISSMLMVVLPFALGIRINLTDSHVPAGLWRSVRHNPKAGDIRVGDIVVYHIYDLYLVRPKVYDEHVVFVVPSMMKRIAALPGSIIERSGDHLLIDGALYANAPIRPPYLDGSDPCKVEYPLIVPPMCVWIMADTVTAYDSRYHGAVPVDIIQAQVKGVFPWQ